MATKRKTPWEKPAPKKSSHKKLTPAQKQSAKRSARRGGRAYPNLVDNMRAASRGKKRSGARKKSGKK